MSVSDGGNSGRIDVSLSTGFPFFGNNYTFLYVHTNGYIPFVAATTLSKPSSFPRNDWYSIAPYWSDVDTRLGGSVYYREVVRFNNESQNNEDLTDRATEIVRDTFVDQDDFMAIWLFIATWDSVSYYGSSNSNLRNTFQAVLVTNGNQSFTFFHYGDIVWTTSTWGGGSADTGLGGVNIAQVGVNAGDGQNFYAVPASGEASIVDIETTSNVGVIGRWIFQIDDVVENGCQEGLFVPCPFVPVPTNGTKNCISDNEGIHFVFACDPGFHLHGSNDIMCQRNGTWAKDPPVCYERCGMGCLNGGTCIINDDLTSFCQCPYGFIGPTCKRVVGYCPCAMPMT